MDLHIIRVLITNTQVIQPQVSYRMQCTNLIWGDNFSRSIRLMEANLIKSSVERWPQIRPVRIFHHLKNLELKIAGAASLQRDQNCNSDLGVIN